MFPGNEGAVKEPKAFSLCYLIEAIVAGMRTHKTGPKLYDFRELQPGMRDLRTTQNYLGRADDFFCQFLFSRLCKGRGLFPDR